MKNGTVKISCALAALALVITAGLSGCGVETNNKNGASPKQNTATSSKNKKQFAKTCLTWRGFLGAWKKPWKTAPNVYKFNIRIH